MSDSAGSIAAIEVSFVDDDPDLRDANVQALRLAGFRAVAEEAERVRAAEREVLEFLRQPGLTVEKLRRFQARFTH